MTNNVEDGDDCQFQFNSIQFYIHLITFCDIHITAGPRMVAFGRTRHGKPIRGTWEGYKRRGCEDLEPSGSVPFLVMSASIP